MGDRGDDVSDPDYRLEFLAALDLLTRASRLMTQAGHPPPILVGGVSSRAPGPKRTSPGSARYRAMDDECAMKRITPAERRVQILRKLAEGAVVPSAEAMRNFGRRRTPEKREMLRRLKELAEQRGQTPWPAKF